MCSEQNEEKNQISKVTLNIFKKMLSNVFNNNPDYRNINSARNHVIVGTPFCLLSVAFERFDFLSHSFQSFVHKILCRACEQASFLQFQQAIEVSLWRCINFAKTPCQFQSAGASLDFYRVFTQFHHFFEVGLLIHYHGDNVPYLI